MTDTPAASATTPPGWYDDGAGSGTTRWWSGVEWTDRVAAPHSTGPVRPALPADRPVYSVFIWLIVLLPLLLYGSFFFWQPNFDYLSGGSFSSTAYLTSLFTPGYFAIVFGGWIVYGLTAVFAWRDAVWLRAQGVVQPFSWPWVFLSSAVYVIGRSVIVHRVAAPRGRAPIWVLIAVLVLGFVVGIAWSVSLVSGMLTHLPTYPSSYSA